MKDHTNQCDNEKNQALMVGTRPWKFPWFQRASFTLGVGLGAVNTLYPLYLNHPLFFFCSFFFFFWYISLIPIPLHLPWSKFSFLIHSATLSCQYIVLWSIPLPLPLALPGRGHWGCDVIYLGAADTGTTLILTLGPPKVTLKEWKTFISLGYKIHLFSTGHYS